METVEGYALIHQSALNLPVKYRSRLATREKWRLRNYVKHPVDPNWETGRYCACHGKFRNAKTRNVGQVILDVVRNENKVYVVRSMFEISKLSRCVRGKGTDLHFKAFYFARRPVRIDMKPSPNGTKLSEQRMLRLNYEIRRRYSAYEAGEKPGCIANEDWGLMCQKAKRRRKCPTCRTG